MKRILWVIIVVGVGTAAYYGLVLRPLPVKAWPVGRGAVVAEVFGTGNLTANRQGTVSAKISGRLLGVTVDQNDVVTTGQLLARLDDSDLRQQVEIARATVEGARASLDRLKAEEARTKAVAAQAKLEFGRFTNLGNSGTVAVSDLDKSREQLQVAEAENSRAAAAIVEGERQIITAEKTLLFQQARLDDTRILAPFAGVITRRDRNTGDIVIPGAAIFQIVSTEDLWVSAWVDETSMAVLSPGQPARVAFRAHPGERFSGEVVRLGREVDRETREFIVDVRLRSLPSDWAMGQRADVFIETGRKKDALALPTKTLRWREGNPGVFIDDRGKATWRPVKLGLQGIETVEVAEGLAAGDTVVTVPEPDAKKLVPGQRIARQP